MADSGLTGDWAGLERKLAEIGSKLKSEVQVATDQNGLILQKAIRGRIEGQKGFKPLSPRYLARKLKLGLSEQILIATATLLNSINYQRLDWNQGFVGVNRHEPKKGYDLGWIHEYGSRDGRVPARPYIEPGISEVRDDIIKRYEDAIGRVFN